MSPRRRAGKKSKRPMPIAPPPLMKSRKRARVVTTLFHKYSRRLTKALQVKDASGVKHYQEEIDRIGGRAEYQRASRLNTSLHSTSRWVLGVLGRMAWLRGIPVDQKDRVRADTPKTSCFLEQIYNNLPQNKLEVTKRAFLPRIRSHVYLAIMM